MPKRAAEKKVESVLLSELDLEKRWGGFVKAGTLRNWRYRGEGPRFTKLGHVIVYHIDDVIAYEKDKSIEPYRRNKNA